jgi:hypothetical protein
MAFRAGLRSGELAETEIPLLIDETLRLWDGRFSMLESNLSLPSFVAVPRAESTATGELAETGIPLLIDETLRLWDGRRSMLESNGGLSDGDGTDDDPWNGGLSGGDGTDGDPCGLAFGDGADKS